MGPEAAAAAASNKLASQPPFLPSFLSHFLPSFLPSALLIMRLRRLINLGRLLSGRVSAAWMNRIWHIGIFPQKRWIVLLNLNKPIVKCFLHTTTQRSLGEAPSPQVHFKSRTLPFMFRLARLFDNSAEGLNNNKVSRRKSYISKLAIFSRFLVRASKKGKESEIVSYSADNLNYITSNPEAEEDIF